MLRFASQMKKRAALSPIRMLWAPAWICSGTDHPPRVPKVADHTTVPFHLDLSDRSPTLQSLSKPDWLPLSVARAFPPVCGLTEKEWRGNGPAGWAGRDRR